ncbi:replication licensing factor Cdt1 [Dermatophagoides pteronyssinus]|uniref:Replication licensing factor Cdt1 n=1 Tax=Dermatophagoides pteronyssinus TaxID=6956 RepID=A0ABQ8JFI6_DERPT|nr:replication licensing factor Cdt1 [Dermatophagoides pteronyssinus]
MKLNLSADDHIYRWHHMFALDSVSDIKPDYTLLPMKPKIRKNSYTTMTNKKSTTILDYFRPKTDSVAKIDDNNNSDKDGDTNKIQSGLLKGISVDLLNKVRAKEAAKKPKKDDLIERISTSVPMSALESRRHLEYLSRFELDAVGSKWIKIIKLRNSKQYVRIDCKYPLAELFSAFNRQKQKLQSN